MFLVLLETVSFSFSLVWTYKDDESATENMGPYAEDINEKFNLGSGKELTTLEMDGVLFSCLKGMFSKYKLCDVVDKRSRNSNEQYAARAVILRFGQRRR